MTKTYQLVGIGNAVVDVIAQCEDSFLPGKASKKASCSSLSATAAKISMRRWATG